MKRRIPRPSELAPLLRFKRPAFGRRARLKNALTIEDLRLVARRRTPRAPFDYADGAAESEQSLTRARQAFHDLEFIPSVLRDVSTVDTSVTIGTTRSAYPFAVAPTGFTRMMNSEGECAGARAAHRRGIPFTLSTMGTASIEAVRDAAPDGDLWFQLYVWRNRTRAEDLMARASAAGYSTLFITVDTPVAGARLRDARNGMTIPPALTMRTIVNAIPRPRWWFDFLTTEPLHFASLTSWAGTVANMIDTMFDPSVTFDDLAWIRSQWPGTLVVKGVQNVDDAIRLSDMRIDGVVLSSHGGRQLDRAPIPLSLVAPVKKAVRQDFTIMVDTGIMSGADIVAALALGADFALVGRAYLCGLMAGGEAGVDRSLEILREGIERTMRLLGVASVDELRPEHVRLFPQREGDN